MERAPEVTGADVGRTEEVAPAMCGDSVIRTTRRSRAGERTGGSEGAAEPFRAYTRVSAVSGIVFAGLFVTALVLVRKAPGIAAPDRVYADFYTVGKGNVLVTAGLYIVPFAGIAYLWHMSATRTLIESLPGASSGFPVGCGACGMGSPACSSRVRRLWAPWPCSRSSRPPRCRPPRWRARSPPPATAWSCSVFGVRAAGMYIDHDDHPDAAAWAASTLGGGRELPRRVRSCSSAPPSTRRSCWCSPAGCCC